MLSSDYFLLLDQVINGSQTHVKVVLTIESMLFLFLLAIAPSLTFSHPSTLVPTALPSSLTLSKASFIHHTQFRGRAERVTTRMEHYDLTPEILTSLHLVTDFAYAALMEATVPPDLVLPLS
jgi:hypothetical protein